MISWLLIAQATQFLRENQWDLESAANHYFSGNDEASEENPEAAPASTGPRTLGGASAPQPTPSTPSAPPTSQSSKPKKKFATLNDLSKSGQSGHGHDHDDDDDDDEDQDLFAGGEKSALAVQNPDDLRRKLVEKARK